MVSENPGKLLLCFLAALAALVAVPAERPGADEERRLVQFGFKMGDAF